MKPATTTGAKLGWVTATALTAVMIAVGFFYGWTVQTTSAEMRPNGPKSDYYNLLVDGFKDGHLYMKVAVDPQLLALRPEQRPGSAPYLLDASLYQGRYYLYFGVTPAVLLFWPFAAVTGHDLPEATGALVFMLLGFGLATAWWLDVRRAYFPRLAPDGQDQEHDQEHPMEPGAFRTNEPCAFLRLRRRIALRRPGDHLILARSSAIAQPKAMSESPRLAPTLLNNATISGSILSASSDS